MRQPSVPAIKADNPRLRMVRIDIGGDARNYTTGQQRVTVVPLTSRRKQNRKVMIPPTGDDSVLGAGGLESWESKEYSELVEQYDQKLIELNNRLPLAG